MVLEVHETGMNHKAYSHYLPALESTSKAGKEVIWRIWLGLSKVENCRSRCSDDQQHEEDVLVGG